ncbi:cytochrome c biogenesis protein CcdA [Gilvimarinus sp. SDUM040013]|uniref:Cytochrome c biogenesis protein CcdA n=1 Tax=Gilvimarinus gilvus TaxID=3058038 RepID=A0ABU4S4N5_9GAMM|nr:cytochrome c biogenesis protein CcdA [Gilvimarinus sp. SDUM040013]MDO3384653.1 cytochrome c biogenesis protein CcdA [Gilvimarinus sp. SDUM040013]MDX6850239.1 cytochrome c biogenesis protein CcdA [Gilvimarinus sp. SDUM040013]
MEFEIQNLLTSGDLSIGIFALVFVAGLLTSLTPCVYPLLPITVAMVGNASMERGNSFINALIYVIGVSATYALLGILAALSGQLFGAVASHPLTLGLMALVCWLFAAWMQGWLVLPSFAPSFSTSAKGPVSLFGGGALSGLVMAPCTSPVLGMLLMYVAANGDWLAGGTLMFLFSLGMSALLLVAGTCSGALGRLPKAGSWMLAIKTILSLLMVAAGLYLAFLSIQNWRIF